MMQFLRYIARNPKALALTILIDVFVCGTLFALVEHHNLIEGGWWTVVTGTTTGYGDLYPKSNMGRGIAVVFMLSMLVLMTLTQSQVTAWLVQDPHIFTDEEQKRLEAKIDRLLQLSETSQESDILQPCLPKTKSKSASLVTMRTYTARHLAGGMTKLRGFVWKILNIGKSKND